MAIIQNSYLLKTGKVGNSIIRLAQSCSTCLVALIRHELPTREPGNHRNAKLRQDYNPIWFVCFNSKCLTLCTSQVFIVTTWHNQCTMMMPFLLLLFLLSIINLIGIAILFIIRVIIFTSFFKKSYPLSSLTYWFRIPWFLYLW